MVRITVLILLALWSSPTYAEKRVALVIGNSAYQFTPKLDNPKNDAADMAAALNALSFEVIDGFDLDKTAFERKVRDFSVALRDAKVGLFFYAGHGLQVAGQNYLVPTDAKAETADALDWEMVRLDLVHRTMERATSTNVIFLDACRNNPLTRNLARAMGTRSTEIGRGLAAVESGVGTLISFSTQPGNVALDGTGRNSPYAGSLVNRITTSKDDLSALLIDVRNDVRKETQNKQVPWEHSALTGRFYFNFGTEPKVPPPADPQAPRDEAERAWAAVKDTINISALELFVARYKGSFYADLARLRIDDLKKTSSNTDRQKSAPATTPPVPKSIAARDLFGAVKSPTGLTARSIGFYAKGCLAGAAALPIDGPAWQAMRLSRNRNWGHPNLVKLIERLAVEAKANDGWPGLLVGDLSQPRGGPMLTGHSSHQTGLDADIWLTPMPDRRLSDKEREDLSATSMLAEDKVSVDPKAWTNAHARLLKRAASYAAVERIFVHPAIKKAMCEATPKGGDRAWLHKIRAFWGHYYHFHIRIGCPKGSSNCETQAPLPNDDGCGKELTQWIALVKSPTASVSDAPARPLLLDELPVECRAILASDPDGGLRPPN